VQSALNRTPVPNSIVLLGTSWVIWLKLRRKYCSALVSSRASHSWRDGKDLAGVNGSVQVVMGEESLPCRLGAQLV